jgi:hypothetical protein
MHRSGQSHGYSYFTHQDLTDENYDVIKCKRHLAMGFWASAFQMSFTDTLLLRKNDVINIKAITCKQNTIKLLECHKEI